jgi:hypothetical protein
LLTLSKNYKVDVPEWTPHKDGLEIERIIIQGRAFRLLLSPAIFVIPKGLQKLARANQYIEDRIPKSLYTFRDVLQAINFEKRWMLMEDSETTGLFVNQIVDRFLGAPVKAELVDGFLRFPLPSLAMHETWHTAYHGTSNTNAGKIFCAGGLKTPAEGAKVVHGQCGSKTKNTIYLSPSREYAAFPTYSLFYELPDNIYAQLVFEVKAKPGYTIQSSTLGHLSHWPSNLRIDPKFETNSGLEWLVESSQDIVLSAILVRMFGAGTDAIFGELNGRVIGSSRGADYHWTDLRKKDAQSKKLVFKKNREQFTAYVRPKETVLGSVIFEPCKQLYNAPLDPDALGKRLQREQVLLFQQKVKELEPQVRRFSPPLTNSPTSRRAHRRERQTRSATTITSTTAVTAPATVISPAQPLYLCVERNLVERVKQVGFSAHRRPYVAVETSVEKALQGYKKHHLEPAAVFRVVPSPHLNQFANQRGSWRIEGKFIPPSSLLQVY